MHLAGVSPAPTGIGLCRVAPAGVPRLPTAEPERAAPSACMQVGLDGADGCDDEVELYARPHSAGLYRLVLSIDKRPLPVGHVRLAVKAGLASAEASGYAAAWPQLPSARRFSKA